MDREYLNNIIVLLVGLISLNLPFMDLNTMSSQSNRINLYISGEGEIVGPTNLSKSSNNLVTIPPTSTNDEFQIYYPKYVPPYDVYYWYSNPLNLNISIEEDVQITIWAVCNKPRYISFTLSIMKYTSSGSGDGIGYGTGAQFVYNEPFEFSVVIPVEELDNNLKDFHLGDYIGIGIMAVFPNPQPPAEVTVLYNSTEHPSHMTINTKSISIDFSNPITIGEKPALDVTITDTFGIYDIADYEVQINGPSGKKFADFEIVEYEYPEQGILILRVIWDKSEDGSGNYSFIVKVIDNNNNIWEEIEVLEYDLSNDRIIEISPYIYILLIIGIIMLILINIFIIRKRKKRYKP